MNNKKTNIELTEVEEIVPLKETITKELTRHNLTESLLLELEKSAEGLEISGIDDKENYELVNRLRISAKNTRVLTTKVCKGLREDSIAYQKEVIRVEKEVTQRLEKVEDCLAAKQKVVDDEKNKIKLEKDTLEQSRLQERAVKLIEYGMNFTGDAYVLDDIKISVLQVKTADEFVFTTLFAAVETRYKAIQDAKRYEEEQREIAAANAKRILEEQLAQAEVLKQREAALEARQKAIEDAELAAKKAAEERIRLAQEEQEKKQREILEAEQKAKQELLKSRMSSLFALGFSQQGKILAFKELQVNLETLLEHTDESFAQDIKGIARDVDVIKTRIERERLAELERVKNEAIAAERKRQEEEAEADRIVNKEKEEALIKENARLEAIKPDVERFNSFCKALSDIAIPEFSTPAYQEFAEVIKADRLLILKNLYTKKPS